MVESKSTQLSRFKMKKIRLRTIYIVTDWVSTLLGVILFSLCRYMLIPNLEKVYHGFGNFLGSHGVLMTLALFPPIMILINYLTGYYVKVSSKSRIDELLRTISAIAVATLIFFFIALLNDFQPMRRIHYELISVFALSLFITVWPSRFLLTSFLNRRLARRSPGRYAMICRGNDIPGSLDAIGKICGNRIISHVYPIDEHTGCDLPVVGIEDLRTLVASGSISGVIIAPSAFGSEELQRFMHILYQLNAEVLVSPDDRALAMGSVVRFDHVTGDPLIDITSPRLPDAMVSIKRFADVTVSGIALVAAAPVILILAAIIRLQSPGPAFYSQERIGFHRRPFMIHKLRSMIVDSEKDKPQLSSDHDPRVTPIGRFMRKYRLDELPNLWNVFVGEMSLVGPRPEREYFIRQIVEAAPHYTLLHTVRPGLTSWGMVKFGYASDVPQMVERLRYDILYIQNLSLEVDVKILMHTLLTIIKGEGK